MLGTAKCERKEWLGKFRCLVSYEPVRAHVDSFYFDEVHIRAHLRSRREETSFSLESASAVERKRYNIQVYLLVDECSERVSEKCAGSSTQFEFWFSITYSSWWEAPWKKNFIFVWNETSILQQASNRNISWYGKHWTWSRKENIIIQWREESRLIEEKKAVDSLNTSKRDRRVKRSDRHL